MPTHYTYIVECDDGTFYTGYTTDPTRRIGAHNDGEGAKYTRPPSRHPVSLVHLEQFDTKSAAMAREYEIKQLTHEEKADLAQSSDIPAAFSELTEPQDT